MIQFDKILQVYTPMKPHHHKQDNKHEVHPKGIPWQSGDKTTAWNWVPSLIEELRLHKTWSAIKNLKSKQEKITPKSSTPLILWPAFYYHRWAFTLLNSVQQNHTVYALLKIQTLSLSIIVLWFIHTGACTSSSFFFIAKRHSII